MTIRRGEAWGREVEPPEDLVTVRSDQELRRLVDASRRTGRPIPPIELRGGDLARTLGVAGSGAGERRTNPQRWRAVPIDLGRVSIDGADHWFAAHLVARRLWWRGPLIATMNAQFIGEWDVAPRSHPNDGRLDVFEVDAGLSLRDRWRARGRLPLGTHLPHPAIAEHRMERLHIESPRPLDLWLDGELVARAADALVVIEPDAAEIYIGSTG